MATTDIATPIKTVLCAIDLSSMTTHVLMAAAEVAQAYDAKLVVLHAVEVWDRRYDFIVDDLVKRIEVDAQAKVHAELGRLGKKHDVPIEVQVVKGHGHVAIISAVKTLRPDLLVIGSHGRRGIDRVLLGSVADSVLRQSPASVLVVRPLRNPDFYTIVCAIDFSDCSRQALERALDLAQRDKVKSIRALHVFEIPVVYVDAGLAYQAAFEQVEKAHIKEMEKFLKPYQNCGVAIESTVQEGPAAPTIMAFADRVNADLLVIGSHGRSRLGAMLIGGVSNKIVHRTQVPLLAVKASDHYESLWAAID